MNNKLPAHNNSNDTITLDALIVGAGFGGLYALKNLRDKLGLTVRVIDKAGGVGGTWFWNKYPGALSDTESFSYCYSWDPELLQEWEITTRYLTQPQILKYLNHVADRHDLRRNIDLETALTQARYDEAAAVWDVYTDNGNHFRARYLITALGILSASNSPSIPGIEKFKGIVYHTSDWPDNATLAGKKVGVIGTGSTGVQVITSIAPIVRHLSVFQRSPQYSVPIGNGPVDVTYVKNIKENYSEIWKGIKNSTFAFGFKESKKSVFDVDDVTRQQIFEDAWNYGGGFRFVFETFTDIATNEIANQYAQDFIRKKIAKIVKDPDVARKLTPHDLYAKRPLCDSGYYQTFNRDNVSLVDIKSTPIVQVTETGVKTSDGVEHELDVLIFATGFDAVDGNYKCVDIIGRGGEHIRDHWESGPSSYVSVATSGFPNLFMVLGPNGPFTNIPPTIEVIVDWITELVKHSENEGYTSVEANLDAESNWTIRCQEIAEQTLYSKADSWLFGANIPGKKKTVYFYLKGLASFSEELRFIQENSYQGFSFGTEANATKRTATTQIKQGDMA